MGYWLYMCFSQEGHIRVADLKHHLKQNTDFPKCIYPEYHLPEYQRMNLPLRIVRLLSYVLFLFMFSSQLTMSIYDDAEAVSEQRDNCAAACEGASYPTLSCAVSVDDGPKHKVEYGAHVYDKLFELRAADVANNTWHRFAGKCLHSAVGTVTALDQTFDGARRLAVCLPSCKLRDVSATLLTARSLRGMGLGDTLSVANGDVIIEEGVDPQPLALATNQFGTTDTRPDCGCRTVDVGVTIQPCTLAELEAGDARCEPCDQFPRDLLCVSQKEPLAPDNLILPLCVGENSCISLGFVFIAIAATNVLQTLTDIICLNTATLADDMSGADMVGEAPQKCLLQGFVGTVVLMSVILAVKPVLQAQRIGNEHILVVAFFACLIIDQLKSVAVQTLTWWLVTRRCGRQGPGIQYYNVEYLLQWELQESLNEEMRRTTREVMEHPRTARFVLYLVVFYGLFVISALVIEEVLTEVYGEEPVAGMVVWAAVYGWVDLLILSIFMIEMIIKTYGFGGVFILDKWNLFDSLVVLVSFVLIFAMNELVTLEQLGQKLSQIESPGLDVVTEESGGSTQGLGLLRLLRLVRVFISIRKVSQNRQKLRDLKKSANSGVEVGSYVERVLELIDELHRLQHAPAYVKQDLDFARDIITSNKLYKVSLQSEGTADASRQLSAWVDNTGDPMKASAVECKQEKKVFDGLADTKNAGSQFQGSQFQGSRAASSMGHAGAMANATGVAASRMGGASRAAGSRMIGTSRMGAPSGVRNGATGRHRSVSRANEQMRQRQEELNGHTRQLYTLCNLSSAEEQAVSETLETFDDYSFDLTACIETMEAHLLAIIFGKLVLAYSMHTILRLDVDLLFNYTISVQQHSLAPRFSNALHICDMLHGVHYCLQQGLNGIASNIHQFLLFLSCVAAYDGHVGVTNDFFVNARHPRAIRYNDVSVRENFALANTFNRLSDPEQNFVATADPDLVARLRPTLVAIILRADLRAHFDELSKLKTALAAEDGMDSAGIGDASILVMAASHRMADMIWAARPLKLYLQWADRFMDELFKQGEVEKALGLPVSPFCDRESTHASRCQLSYIVVLVEPLARAYSVLLSSDKFNTDVLTQGLEANNQMLQGWLH